MGGEAFQEDSAAGNMELELEVEKKTSTMRLRTLYFCRGTEIRRLMTWLRYMLLVQKYSWLFLSFLFSRRLIHLSAQKNRANRLALSDRGQNFLPLKKRRLAS